MLQQLNPIQATVCHSVKGKTKVWIELSTEY